MKVLVDYNKILDYYKKNDSEYDGSQGFCYVKDGQISKIYYEPRKLKYDFSKYKSSKIAFPVCYLYDKNADSFQNVVGELMDFFPGKSLAWSIDEDIKIDKFIKQYIEIIDEIKRHLEILMIDLSYPNILYNREKGFHLIDSTSWIINEENGIGNTCINIDHLNIAINETILKDYLETMTLSFNPYFFKNLKRMGVNGKNLSKLLEFSIKMGRWSIVELLELYKEIFKNCDLGTVETFSDIKKYTKMLKKVDFKGI